METLLKPGLLTIPLLGHACLLQTALDPQGWVHWSRRTLQYALRDAYGCSPMQWVRRRRLHRAMQRLKNPAPGDTVTSIGQALGFPSAAAFSGDFRRHFGCTPSSVFRG
jgi:AraC-like DNA-binding protein